MGSKIGHLTLETEIFGSLQLFLAVSKTSVKRGRFVINFYVAASFLFRDINNAGGGVGCGWGGGRGRM